MGIKRIWKLLVRRKVLEDNPPDEKPYTNLDLFALGINSAFGLGFYSIIGYLSYYTGPSAIISIFIAAIAAILSSFCYAEFGVRIRHEGSSYIYSYVSLGELLAFIVGWTLILEFITGIANLSRVISYIINVMANGEVYDCFIQILTIDIHYFSSFIDFIAFGVPILLAIIVQIPIPSCPKLNKYVALVDVLMGLAIIIIIGITQDFGTIEWTVDEWFPNDVHGIINALPICFCVFISLEFITMAKIDTTNHISQKSTINPLVTSLIFNAISVCAITLVTYFVMKQYYVETTVEPRNVVLDIFLVNKLIWAKWFVIVCEIIALTISIYFILIALPKILYKMVHDSILFNCLGRNSETYKKPIFGTFLITVISGILGAFFTNEFLLNLLALGVLLTFTLVAVSTLILRYTDGRIQKEEYLPSEMTSTSISNLIVCEDHVTVSDYFGQLFNKNKVSSPTPVTTLIVQVNTTFFCICALLLNGFLVFGENSICEGQIWIFVVIAILIVLHLIILLTISLQPTGKRNLTFKVPMVPILPAISVLINVYIMLQLDYEIWTALGIWIAIGLCIYFTCLKIYKRSDNKSTFSLNRKTLNGIMNFAYDNEVNFEEAVPLPKENTPPTLRTSRAINLRPEDEIQSISNEEEQQIGKLENMIEEDEQQSKFDDKEMESDSDDDNLGEYRPNRTSSATDVLNMLDKVLAYESDGSGDNLSSLNLEIHRKLSFDTESIHSTPDPIEHSALVHREDSTSNVANLLNVQEEIPEHKSSTLNEDVTAENGVSNIDQKENEANLEKEIEEKDDVVEDISKVYDTIPKTPNVSRVESFMRPSLSSNQKTDMDFALKLNQLLQEQLQEKPHNKGLYKPEIYDEEEKERKLSATTESNSGLLAEINKEILARKKLKSQNLPVEKKAEDTVNETESENMKPSDIRNKLELIYKTGPRNPEDVQKTLRKSIAVVSSPNQNDNANEPENINPPDDPNNSSVLAQQLRARKTLITKPDSGIDSGNSSTISNEENGRHNEKQDVSEEEPEIETPADIRMRLNLILSKGPQHPFQFGNKKHLSAPSNLDSQKSSVENTEINKNISNTPKSSPRSSKILNNKTDVKSLNNVDDTNIDYTLVHKNLMGNVFKSIKERKQEPVARIEGTFLTKLKNQNERVKKNEVIPVSTN